MPMQLTWYGHNAWLLEADGSKVLIDPFLNDSPVSPVKAEEVECDYILLSHGHFDHVGDTVDIAKRTGATVVTAFEISQWLTKQGVPEGHAVGLNPGGGVDLPFGRVKATPACHSSSLPDGTYAGVAMGLEVTTAGKRLYFACDTSLLLEMKLIGDPAIGGGPLDLAVLPIGDLFTMGPDDAVEATKLLRPAKVLPCHYNTFGAIEQDAAAWAEQVKLHTAAEPVVLEPGGSLSLG